MENVDRIETLPLRGRQVTIRRIPASCLTFDVMSHCLALQFPTKMTVLLLCSSLSSRPFPPTPSSQPH